MTQLPGKDPKVALVTGATGYIGSRLAKALVGGGWKVHALLRDASDSSELEKFGKQIKLRRLSGGTPEIAQIVKEAKPDAVFHLASEVLIRHEMDDVEDLIESNILFGTQLLEATVRTRVPFFVNTGSYWQHDEGPGYNPVNLYAGTKQAFEDILRFYTKAFPLRALTLKLFDVYGPGDTRNKLFNQLERASETGESLAMSPGEQLLDLVYIDDVTEAYEWAAQLLTTKLAGELGESYAVSSLRRLPLREVVEIYERVAGRRVPVIWGGRPYRAREVMKPWEGEILPGWQPRTDLETGIARALTAAKR